MAGRIRNKLKAMHIDAYHFLNYNRYFSIYRRLRTFTMIPLASYVRNIRIAKSVSSVQGCIVECGTWRGGMIAGISAAYANERECFLYDSFEGLPPASINDGDAALNWQQDVNSPYYYDNCKAELAYAESAMKLSGATNYHIIKGWFNETLPRFDRNKKIAVLRLDGDWYDSTMDCLVNLYDCVEEGGVIIIDDYYHWTGCSRAIHDFFAKQNIPVRIRQLDNDICYFIKTSHT